MDLEGKKLETVPVCAGGTCVYVCIHVYGCVYVCVYPCIWMCVCMCVVCVVVVASTEQRTIMHHFHPSIQSKKKEDKTTITITNTVQCPLSLSPLLLLHTAAYKNTSSPFLLFNCPLLRVVHHTTYHHICISPVFIKTQYSCFIHTNKYLKTTPQNSNVNVIKVYKTRQTHCAVCNRSCVSNHRTQQLACSEYHWQTDRW